MAWPSLSGGPAPGLVTLLSLDSRPSQYHEKQKSALGRLTMADGKMPPVWSGRKKADVASRPAFWQRCALAAFYVVFALVLVASLCTQPVMVLVFALAELTVAYLAIFVSLSGGRELPIEPPRSLLRAMQAFFVGVTAGRIRQLTTHRSMLIHPSKATATHRQYCDWTNNVRGHWHRILVEGADLDRQDLLEGFRRAHADLSRTCSDLPPFEEIAARLPVSINQTEVTLVNSVDGREVRWQNGYSHILVGGRSSDADTPSRA